MNFLKFLWFYQKFYYQSTIQLLLLFFWIASLESVLAHILPWWNFCCQKSFLTKWIYLVLFLKKKNQIWSKHLRISFRQFKLTLVSEQVIQQKGFCKMTLNLWENLCPPSASFRLKWNWRFYCFEDEYWL